VILALVLLTLDTAKGPTGADGESVDTNKDGSLVRKLQVCEYTTTAKAAKQNLEH
jgi:hypothetical protein